MKKFIIGFAVMGFIAAAIPAASAAEIVITQAGKKFDKKKVEIGAGDTIKFVNADKMGHNINSKGADAFDLGLQKPGADMSRKFAKAGEYKLRCTIHPKMKLKVTVK